MFAFAFNLCKPTIDCSEISQQCQRFLLSQQVDVIRILHLIEQADDFFACKGHSKSDCCRSPCLAEGVEYDDIRVVIEQTAERLIGREVAICLVNHHDSFKRSQHFMNGFAREIVASRIVGRANPNHLCMRISCIQ